MHPRTLLMISAMLCCNAALAGLKEGYDALARKDYARAIKEYRPLAERGDPEAQYRIGRLYEFGNGYPKDQAQGIAWIRKAAAQNHIDAQQELGVIYAIGDGVQQDDVQAVAWFRKAAMQGDAMAQYNLGLLYAKGAGCREGLWAGDRLVAQVGDPGLCRRAVQAGRRLPERLGRGQGSRSRTRQRRNRGAGRQQGTRRLSQRHREAAHAGPKAQRPCAGQCMEGRPADAGQRCRVGFGVEFDIRRAHGRERSGEDAMFGDRNHGWREIRGDQLRRVAVWRSAQRRDLVQRRSHRAG